MTFNKKILLDTKDRKNFFLDDCKNVVIRKKNILLYTPSSILDFFANWGEGIEPELLNWIDRLPKSSTLYDIGASNGFFSIYAYLHGLKVCSFEPDALNYSILIINQFVNNLSYNAYNLAISNQTKPTNLKISRFGFGMHNKVLESVFATDNSIEHMQSVLSFKLDDLTENYLFNKARYVKIDVDGAELEVLKGGIRFFDNVEEVFIELSKIHENYNEICKVFSDYGFTQIEETEVNHPNGGVYESLYNVVYKRIR